MRVKSEWVIGILVTIIIAVLSFLSADKVNALTDQGKDNSDKIAVLQTQQAVTDERYTEINKKIDLLLSKNGIVYREIQGSVASSSISKQ